MSTVLHRTDKAPKNGATAKARADAVTALRPPKPPTKKRWGRMAVGLAAALIGSWVFAAMYMSAGDRTEVLVLTSKVNRLETIDRADLRTVRISSDTNAANVPASRIEEIVGRVAVTDLTEGSILTDSQLLPVGEKLLKPDEAVVGVLLGAGDSQMNLRRGVPVLLIVRPAPGASGGPVEVTGWVYSSSAEALSSRERPVEVVVPRTQAGVVSAAGAEKRVTIVLLPG